MTTPESKTCTKCGETKPLAEFDFNRARRDGHASVCKTCARKKRKQWYAANREANLAYQAEWRAANREKKSAGDRAWRKANPDRKRENDRLWGLANRERKELQIKAWRKANPQRVHDWRRDRRARQRAAYVAPVRFDEIIQRDLGICGICEKQILESTVELDHIIPLLAGGTHEPDNIQLAHRSCNRRKWATADFRLPDAA